MYLLTSCSFCCLNFEVTSVYSCFNWSVFFSCLYLINNYLLFTNNNKINELLPLLAQVQQFSYFGLQLLVFLNHCLVVAVQLVGLLVSQVRIFQRFLVEICQSPFIFPQRRPKFPYTIIILFILLL